MPHKCIKAFTRLTRIAASGDTEGCVQIAGLCSGSGMGEISCANVIKMLPRVARGDVPSSVHAFSCDTDVAKAAHLKKIGCDLVFMDITKMGGDVANVHGSETGADITSCGILFCGFSCKDWSAFMSDATQTAEYIKTVLERFLEDPNAELPESPMGTTLPTLLGLLLYILRYRPPIVILENTPKVAIVLPTLSDIFLRLGYAFGSRPFDPQQFNVPNSRPCLSM